jgi:phosphate uptake regulator
MDIESRKVQRLGYSSVGISLPKDWADEIGLTPGSTVTVSRDWDGSLNIRPGLVEEDRSGSRCTILADKCKAPESLLRAIIGCYVVGRDVIQVRAKKEFTQDQIHEIYDAVQRLTGLTVVEQGPNFAVLSSFVEPTKFPIAGLMRRLYFLASRMTEVAVECAVKRDENLLKEVIRLEDEVDRLYALVVRQLLLAARSRIVSAKIGAAEPRNIVGDRVVATTLEGIADLAATIAQDAWRAPFTGPFMVPSFVDELEGLNRDVGEIAKAVRDSFFKEDITLANDALEMIERLSSKTGALLVKVPDTEHTDETDSCSRCVAERHMVRSFDQMGRLYATIGKLTINRAMESPNDLCRVE